MSWRAFVDKRRVVTPERGWYPLITSICRGALLVAMAMLATAIGAPTAQSASSRSCALSEHERYPHVAKPTYNLSLKARGTSCATAKKVMNAFHKCRSRTGYRCTKKVLRSWSCKGKKTSSIPTEFDGSFTCTYGSRRVDSTYQQNTA
ncbi:MAG: hypothetical protein QOJ46_1554 [bacterium]